MKKVIFTFFVLTLSFTLIQAQDFANKGVAELGGSVSFSSTTAVSDGETADESTSTFTFSPFVGYFLINGLELGLMPSFSSSSFGDNTNSSISIFVIPAYYFNLKSNVYPYIGGAVGYTSRTHDDGTNSNTTSGLSYGALGGVKVQVGKAALVNFGVSYYMYTYNPEDWDGDRNGYNRLAIFAGVAIFFGG